MYSFKLPEDHPLRRKSKLDQSKEKSLTQQDFAEQCDINNLVQRFLAGEEFKKPIQQFIDCMAIAPFQESLEATIKARESFEALPSKVRKFYLNDPTNFLRALNDPAEKENLKMLGVIKQLKKEKPVTSGDPANPTGAAGTTGGTGVAGGATAPSGTKIT